MSGEKSRPTEGEGYSACALSGVKIADEVVSAIAAISAMETKGVYGLNGGITYSNRNKLSAKALKKCVKIICTDRDAVIYLSILIKYGFSIPETCDAVKEKVASAVGNMTGLRVSSVHIKVKDVIVED